jgi:hypothetical protein
MDALQGNVNKQTNKAASQSPHNAISLHFSFKKISLP